MRWLFFISIFCSFRGDAGVLRTVWSSEEVPASLCKLRVCMCVYLSVSVCLSMLSNMYWGGCCSRTRRRGSTGGSAGWASPQRTLWPTCYRRTPTRWREQRWRLNFKSGSLNVISSSTRLPHTMRSKLPATVKAPRHTNQIISCRSGKFSDLSLLGVLFKQSVFF